MNNETAVVLFITNYISIEKCDRRQKKGRAVAGWQQSSVNTVADELRGCHQHSCDQSHVAVCLSAAYVRHCVGVFLCWLNEYCAHISEHVPVFVPSCVCRPVLPVGLQRHKCQKIPGVVQSVNKSFPEFILFV